MYISLSLSLFLSLSLAEELILAISCGNTIYMQNVSLVFIFWIFPLRSVQSLNQIKFPDAITTKK